MSLGSVLELTEDRASSPRPTLVPRRAEEPRESLIFSAHKAALQGRLIQREGSIFLWFTFPKAHVFVPVVQSMDPSLPGRIQQVLERKGTVSQDRENIVVQHLDAVGATTNA